VRLLAIVVVILGIAVGVTTITSEQDPGPRTGPVSNSEAMQKVKQPHWVTFVNPILGAAGVLIGGRRAAARMVAG
jgi:hypothetical protein